LVADKKKDQPAPKIYSSAPALLSKQVASRSGAQATGGKEDLLVVTIETTKAGAITIKVRDTPAPLTQLAGRVRVILNGRADKAVRILAPGTIEIKSIVAVIDELKAGGAEAIGFGIKSP
jgi:biopolymer transport protein ExbD